MLSNGSIANTALKCLLTLLLLGGGGASAQTLITGQVGTSRQTPLSGATITITDEADNIIKYAITDGVGRFTLKVNSPLANFTITVRNMGHAAQSKKIDNRPQHLTFVLKEEATILKEVTVQNNNPIRKKGDTLSYIVNEFAAQKDRSIADVLAKMPGIEVQADGKVLYMGKPIQKYYIEGMDLLEGKYNLANNNLPHQSVTSVQVIENHQPIRVLDSLVSSDRASINIKLKNNITVTGTAKLGLGLSPLLWTANLTPMLFNKKRQVLLSYQANNIGLDIAKELKTHTLQELMENLDNPMEKRDLLNIMAVQLPNIASHRYLNNNAQMLTANHIQKLKKDKELRFNISYLNDAQLQEGNNTTEYFLPTGNVVVQERISKRIFANDLHSNLALEKNTPNQYLKNSLKVQINWEGQRGIVVNNASPIAQQLQNPYYSISNQLKTIRKLGKRLFTFYSLLNYNRAPQALTVLPGQFKEVLNNNAPYDKTQQDITVRGGQANHYLEFTNGAGPFTFGYKAGLNIQQQKTESWILANEKLAGQNFQNDQTYTNTNLYIISSINYKKNKWDVQAKLPLQYTRISIKNALAAYRQNNSGTVVQPRVSLNWKINEFWQSLLGVGYNNGFQNANQVLTGYVLKHYRNLQQQNYPIAQARSYDLFTAISYRNIIKSVFFHVFFTHVKTRNPFMLRNEIQPNGTQTLSVQGIVNHTRSYTLNSKISKYLHRIKTTVAFSFDANYQQGNQLLGSQLAKTINQLIKPGFKINAQLSKKLGLDYLVETSLSHNKTAGVPAQDIVTLGEQLRLNLYATSNQYAGLAIEHYYNDAVTTGQHNIYTDLFYRYTIAKRKTKKKIDLELHFFNLFNTQRYIRSNFSDFYFSQSIIPIRPRQLLATINFGF
jgi:hypothetical protein